MSCTLSRAMAGLAAFLFIVSTSLPSAAQPQVNPSPSLPLDVEIGNYFGPSEFQRRGYGIIVRYAEQCLVLTLSHVAYSSEFEFDGITARSRLLGEASPQYIYHNVDKDIYVGRIVPGSELHKSCEFTAEIEDLYTAYITELRRIIFEDRKIMTLHHPPHHVKLAPSSDGMFADALREEPLRYRLAACKPSADNECTKPSQKMSGSTISLPTTAGSRIMLGMHQGICGEACSREEPEWQAVSVLAIYSFLTSPTFPSLSKDKPLKSEMGDGPDRSAEVFEAIQRELVRLKCQPGAVDGIWGRNSKRAFARFETAYPNYDSTYEVNESLLEFMRKQKPNECPTVCSAGQILSNGVCRQKESRPRRNPTNRATDNCIHVNGEIACRR